MQVDIRFSPSFAIAVLTIPAGGEIKAEAGAMTSMSGGVEIETKAQGGVMAGLKRSVLGGESFFINTFRAPQGGRAHGRARRCPATSCTCRSTPRRRSWCSPGHGSRRSTGVQVDTKWGGAKTFFSGEGLFLLRCTGAGRHAGVELRRDRAAPARRPARCYKIDTGHIVAFEEGIGYEVNKVGGWKSTLLSGEGLVATFTGPGTLWMQTRSPADFIGWLIPQLPTQRS